MTQKRSLWQVRLAARGGSVSLLSLVVCLLAVVTVNFAGVIPPWSLRTAAVAAGTKPEAEPAIDFNRDIRPILSNSCYACHGPDAEQRQAGLRLDTHEGALAKLESGSSAVVPGDQQASELIRRITSDAPEQRMPPPDYDHPLTDEQIALLTRWVRQDAPWSEHWSFVAPRKTALPEVAGDFLLQGPIDHFVVNRAVGAGLGQSPRASRETLIRRVTFDLTGLPPTPADVDAFLADTAPGAWERVVDRLLGSEAYGEHMARHWLDAARYGDTHGLHLDNERSIWLYRDWVIDAFNRNMPFDRFTIEQIAGDLLPDATVEQKVATGFNRCNVSTSEGGAIAEEWRVRYAIDRVETLSTVWMGLTMGCAVCHDHKFDPVSQTEFYRLYAYYNSVADRAMDGNALLPPPSVQVLSEENRQKLSDFDRQVAALEQQLREQIARVEYVEPENSGEGPLQTRADFVWVDDALPAKATPGGDEGGKSWQFVAGPEHPVSLGEKSSMRTASGRSQHFFTGANPPLQVGRGDVLFAMVYLDPENPPEEIMLQFNDGSWEHRAWWGADKIEWGTAGEPSRRAMGALPAAGEWVRLEVPVSAVGLKPGSKINGWACTQFGGTVYWDALGIATETQQAGQRFDSLVQWEALQKKFKGKQLKDPVKAAVLLDADKRTPEQQQKIREWFLIHAWSGSVELLKPLNDRLESTRTARDNYRKQIPSTLVMQELPEPRECFVLTRGQYDMPDKEQPVAPGVPAVLPALPGEAEPNRLGLARWLVRDDHPLTARVTVNRLWQQLFGIGLVQTSEDFGVQGERPSHPQLLDWLAVDFVENGWDVKRLIRQIVTSATYCQASRVLPEHVARDPQNRLLARGARFRLDAEMIRDQALALSGLLVEDVGGPSVKPYQPAGLWKAVGYTNSNTAVFKRDSGSALYRRSVYTFWKRTSPPPTMSTFDAPSREACTVRRGRTNTPLQALVLMNDVQFVEAARHMAERVVREGGASAASRLQFAFRLATSRMPDEQEQATLQQVYSAHLAHYQSQPEAAKKLLSVGESSEEVAEPSAELAAWTMICNLILNLDETVTRG